MPWIIAQKIEWFTLHEMQIASAHPKLMPDETAEVLLLMTQSASTHNFHPT